MLRNEKCEMLGRQSFTAGPASSESLPYLQKKCRSLQPGPSQDEQGLPPGIFLASRLIVMLKAAKLKDYEDPHLRNLLLTEHKIYLLSEEKMHHECVLVGASRQHQCLTYCTQQQLHCVLHCTVGIWQWLLLYVQDAAPQHQGSSVSC